MHHTCCCGVRRGVEGEVESYLEQLPRPEYGLVELELDELDCGVVEHDPYS